MKVGVVPKQDALLENRLFEFDNEYNALAAYGPDRVGFHRMQEQLQAEGHEAVTIDQAPLDDFDVVLFVDMDFRRLNDLLALDKTPPLVYLMREPPAVTCFNDPKRFKRYAPLFNRVLTWNDSLAERDNRYIRYRIPQYQQREWELDPSFGDKDLLVNISSRKYSRHSNELYTQRERVIRHFDQNHPTEFTLYGLYWNDPPRLTDLPYLKLFPNTYETYAGVAESKINVYHNHRFALCFENMTNIRGYITEKIFDAFRAGIVPVYWGATNVTDEIPEDIFIDYREFSNPESLYEHLISINESEYRAYRKRIQAFLNEGFTRFSPDRFAKRVHNVIMELPSDQNVSIPNDVRTEIKRRARLQRLSKQPDQSKVARLATILSIGIQNPSLLSDHYVALYNAFR